MIDGINEHGTPTEAERIEELKKYNQYLNDQYANQVTINWQLKKEIKALKDRITEPASTDNAQALALAYENDRLKKETEYLTDYMRLLEDANKKLGQEIARQEGEISGLKSALAIARDN